MLRRKLQLLGLLCLPLALLFFAGCGGSSQSSLASPSDSLGEVAPPIHVNFSRAGVSYTPTQIRHAYGFDMVSGTGSGQTIAIVDAYGSPTIQNDLNTFNAQFGLPSATLTIAYPGGKPSKSDSGWALETALDVEWAHAIAPGAKILLVVARSSSLTDLLPCVDYAAQNAAQVSMSWASSEFSSEKSYDTHFNKAGVSFFAASGDSGAGASWPAVSSYVVGVGGTTLSLDSAGNRLTESAWSGSGGGQSSYITEPAYQQAWFSASYRKVPDVSYDADPNTGFQVYDSTQYQRIKGWLIVGGTSAGTPQWTALCALVNANRSSGLSSADAALYNLGSPATYKSYYYDIITGNNGKYQATTGYDQVTGIGTPLASTLIPQLIAN